MATKHRRHENRAEKYTDPALRERLKDEIMRGDKGGQPGRWSARKSQLLAAEYERHGGGYTTKEKDEAAKSLDEWTQEDWGTEDGGDRARHGPTTERYLPKAVWTMLSEKEKEEAERTKEAASRRGERRVDWPEAVKRATARFEKDHENRDEPTKDELMAEARELGVAGRSKMTKAELAKAVGAARG